MKKLEKLNTFLLILAILLPTIININLKITVNNRFGTNNPKNDK